MKVLVVDDEFIIRVGIQTILEQASGDYEYVGSAGNGKSALKEIELLQPDIVITDIKMPEMDGIQLIQEIRKRKWPIGIVVLSSYSEFELVKEAMKQGAADYILRHAGQAAELSSPEEGEFRTLSGRLIAWASQLIQKGPAAGAAPLS